MKFAKYLRREAVVGWERQYIQYAELKALIKEFKKNDERNGASFHARVSAEVRKATRFYELQLALLEKDVQDAARTKLLMDNEADAHESAQTRQFNREKLLLKFHFLGEQITKLFHFLKLNTTALRKILKKFNRRVTFDGPNLLTKVKENQLSQLASDLRELRDPSLLQPSIEIVERGIIELQNSLITTNNTNKKSSPTSPLPVVGYSPIAAVRYGQYWERGKLILDDMYAMREEMRQSNEFLSFLSSRSVISFKPTYVREQSTIDVERDSSQYPILPPRSGMKGFGHGTIEHKPSQYINLASTFLYLANYNICLPTAGQYSVAVGLRSSSAGIIVAMTPVAALLSAVVYSYWSNFSFKQPLMCSALFLVVGNVMYAMAWDWHAASFLLAGRFISGLGGCRAVNRRYIADTINVQSRTKASAAFVAAGALGMACGPLLASIFADFDLKLGTVTLNAMTSPAWFMTVVWALFGIIIWIHFQEPPTTSFTSNPQPTATEESIKNYRCPNKDRKLHHWNSSGGRTDLDELDVLIDSENDHSGHDGELDDDSIDIVVGSPVKGSIKGYGTIGEIQKPSNTKEIRRSRLTMYSLMAIFWVKLVQEAELTEIPIVAPELFDWSVRTIGLFMVGLGLFVVPANYFLVLFSRTCNLPDTFWIQALFFVMFVSLISILLGQGSLSVSHFIVSDIGLFVSAQVLEGVVMSFFSKVISSQLASGTFNSGFLATEAGTLGRACGNAIITVLGSGSEIALMWNLTVFLGSVTFLLLLLTLGLLGFRKKASNLFATYAIWK